MAELGVIPKAAAKKIWDKGKNATFDVARIDAIEREVKHDVIAFLTHLAEIVGPEARFVHQGMTSSDVLDTCFNVQLVRAADILIADVDELMAALQAARLRAQNHADHRPLARHPCRADDLRRQARLCLCGILARQERLVGARKEVATCAISGAVGTFAQIDPAGGSTCRQGDGARGRAGLDPGHSARPPRHVFATLGVVASSVERLATEIRHLQRTEVLEAEEFFSEGQKGSSAMPHKRNPVLSENVTGLARMVRAYVTPALENVALWHERDISHSSVERMIGPDATGRSTSRSTRLAGHHRQARGLSRHMQKNLDRLGGLVHSQRVMIALTQKGVAREDAYASSSATP